MTIEYGDPLNISNLDNFANEYLTNTEPNVMIKPSKNIIIKENTNNIQIIETLERPKDEPQINKQMITTLGLQNFEISIRDDKTSEKLVFGKYSDDDFKQIGQKIDEIMEYFNQEQRKQELSESFFSDNYYDFPVNYLICYNNEGKLHKIFAVGSPGVGNYIKDKDLHLAKKEELINNIKMLIQNFLEKHNQYLNLKDDDLKNKIYIYRITTPYSHGIKHSRTSDIGMQAEGGHMDECVIGSDFIDGHHCELSSIIYTNVSNQISPVKNYYASAAFFYAPEFPMPVPLSNTLTNERDKNLPNFQNIYKRLFVSAPMTSSGWAIWKNQPKRYKKNITGNRFNTCSDKIFKINKNKNFFTHFSEDNNEFIWHLSPFKTAPDVENLWAPSSVENSIKRSNFTVRRTNYNLFRYLRDLFDDNLVLKDLARQTIKEFEIYLRIYENLNYTETDRDIILLNKLHLILNKLIKISDGEQQDSKLENTKVARILYYNFKNKSGKFRISNSLEMLYNFIEALEDTLSNEEKRKKVLLKYTLTEDQIISKEEYRNYLKKYLKYKQKYIELKNKLPNN
jgi:hypothetical protein